MIEKKTLVSVIVLSYNSETTILETLDSIYNQTYSEIELIVTDDCSKDNTKNIVLKWIASHKDRFVSVKTNFKEKNSGVSINGDEGIKLSTGQWIKCIAADDKLLENCIEGNLKYVEENESQIVFSKMLCYLQSQKKIISVEKRLIKKLKKFSALSESKQYRKLLKEDILPAPTAFFTRNLYDKVGGFDKEISMVEDWPFWIKVAEIGVHIFYNDDFTVVYRVSDTSISHNANFWKEQKKIKEKYCYPNISPKHFLYFYHEKWYDKKWLCRMKVKNNRILCILNELIFGIFWPPYLVQCIYITICSFLQQKGFDQSDTL